MPERVIRERSASLKTAVKPLACSHIPHASEPPVDPVRVDAPPGRPGKRWRPHNYPDPDCRTHPPPKRTARTLANPFAVSIHANTMPRPPLEPIPRHALCGQGIDHAIIDHAGGMHHSPQRILTRRHRVEQPSAPPAQKHHKPRS